MDFIDEIKALGDRVGDRVAFTNTEEATKTAFVMPFVRALGYDTEDPREVVPEFTADFGAKKSDKDDYAIIMDGKPVLVIECKPASADLDQNHVSQLFQYFAASDAKFGLLTNGIVYRFYSDLDQRNKMDHRPFLEINLLNIDDASVEELKRFTKSAFNIEAVRKAFTDLKYTKEIKRILAEQLRDPSEEFVRVFASQIHSGAMTKKVKDRFARFTREAFNQFINDRVDSIVDRAKSSVAAEPDVSTLETATANDAPILDEPSPRDRPTNAGDDALISTTEQELEGYFIVKSILHGTVDLNRVAKRDVKSYFGILLDNKNTKPLCRLWFNRSQKYLGLFDDQKREKRLPIDKLDEIYQDEIYQYGDQLRATARQYDPD